MLTLFRYNGALPLQCDDYYIKELASGLDELIFDISIWDEAYPLIQEEGTILERSADGAARYLVKAIDGGGETANIKCQIDLDAWKQTLTVSYKSASATVAAIVRSVAPAGWAVTDRSGLTYRRTIELESATPLDVLEQCRNTFPGVSYRFDTETKTVTIVNMTRGQNLGAYATRDLNLRENNYKGKSTGFITRLYAYGKDGLSFASINGGKAYVENHTYSSRIICGYWKDERYTVPENLLADAQSKLADLAKPQRTYECDVVDLSAISREKYGFLDFELFSVVTLIDQTRSGAKIEHVVSERWRYPNRPDQNKVILSTVAPRIQSQVAQAISNFNNPNSVWAQQQRSAQENAIENATSQITGSKGGNMRAIYDSSGNWTELVVMNTEDILTASKLWRFNLGGFGYSPNGYNGPYTTAITMDGAIVADFITTGTLNAALAEVINLNASNISTGTLSANRIAANSIAVSKLTGSIATRDWNIDLDNGTFTIGTVTADNINVSNLQAISASLAGWTLSTTRISKEVAGQYQVYMAAPANPTDNSDAFAVKVPNSAGTGLWYNFLVTYGGKMFARNAEISGKVTATSGTIGGCAIENGVLKVKSANISSINADTITVGTLNVARIADGSITGTKVGSKTLTGGNVVDYAFSTGQIATSGLDNRCFASGSIFPSTCNATINGYFADIIETQKLYAGSATVNYLSAGIIRGNRYAFTSTGGTLWRLSVDTSTGYVKASI